MTGMETVTQKRCVTAGGGQRRRSVHLISTCVLRRPRFPCKRKTGVSAWTADVVVQSQVGEAKGKDHAPRMCNPTG